MLVFEQWDTGAPAGQGGGLAPSDVKFLFGKWGKAVIRIGRVINWSANLASACLCYSLP